jgi:hypothetical protein
MKMTANLASSTSRIRRGLYVAMLFSLFTLAARAQATANLSGLWKQDNDRCQPKRSGDVTLRIEEDARGLMVETSISRDASGTRHAVQRYTTDGKITVSTGADGDEFHTSVVKTDVGLVFSIEEHEDGHVLHSKEIWTVVTDGNVLKRTRERSNGERQILVFRRQQ